MTPSGLGPEETQHFPSGIPLPGKTQLQSRAQQREDGMEKTVPILVQKTRNSALVSNSQGPQEMPRISNFVNMGAEATPAMSEAGYQEVEFKGHDNRLSSDGYIQFVDNFNQVNSSFNDTGQKFLPSIQRINERLNTGNGDDPPLLQNAGQLQ